MVQIIVKYSSKENLEKTINWLKEVDQNPFITVFVTNYEMMDAVEVKGFINGIMSNEYKLRNFLDLDMSDMDKFCKCIDSKKCQYSLFINDDEVDKIDKTIFDKIEKASSDRRQFAVATPMNGSSNGMVILSLLGATLTHIKEEENLSIIDKVMRIADANNERSLVITYEELING